MTRTSREAKELNEAKEMKRKGKEALAEEPQRKKRFSHDDTVEFIKLKRNGHSVVEQLKKQTTQISILSICYHLIHIKRH